MWREYLQRVLHWVGLVIRQPWEELNRWQRAARFSYDLSRYGAAQLKEDRALQMAAALSFQVVFALVPVLVVVMIFAQAFMPLNEINQQIGNVLNWAELSDVSVTVMTGPSQVPQVISLEDWLSGLIKQAANANLTVVGWVGFALIVYSAISMLVTVETSFNTVYRAPAGRPWSRRIPLYWFLVTISPAAIYLTVAAHTIVEEWAENTVAIVDPSHREESARRLTVDEIESEAESEIPPVESVDPPAAGTIAETARGEVRDSAARADTPWYLMVVHIAWSLTIGWLFWFVVYSLVPNTTVSLQASAIGALVCSILIEIAKRSLGAYLSNAFTVSQFYGSLGLVPLFMFWVYLMWVFVLFGLEVSATLQFLGNRALEEIENRRATAGLVEPAAVVSVMEVVAEDFAAGESTPQRKIADRTGVPERAVAAIVQELCTAGLLHRIDRDQNSVCLAQTPEAVTADRLMDVGFQLADGMGERRISQFAVRLREHQRALAKSITLASLVPTKPA